MIQSIEVTDYLCFERASVKPGGKNCFFVGDNGTGKSAMLEAIPYCLFNVNRKSARDLTRSGQEGHSVKVVMDIPGYGDVEIVRGFRGKGSVAITYWETKKHPAGGLFISLKGSEAEEEIARILKTTGEEFMLTRYFGLESKMDQLIDVAPATRLETIQSISGVEDYPELLKLAKQELTTVRAELIGREGGMEVLKGRLENPQELKRSMEVALTKLEKLKLEQEDLQEERNKLSEVEGRYQVLLQERSKLEGEISGKSSQLKSDLSVKDKLDDRIAKLRGAIKDWAVEREQLKKILADNPPGQLRTSIRETQGRLIHLKTHVDLRKKALKEVEGKEAQTICPVCGEELSEGTIETWTVDVGKMEAEIKTLGNYLVRLETVWNKGLVSEVRLKEVVENGESETVNIEELLTELADRRNKCVQLKDSVERLKQRLTKVKDTLSEFQDMGERLRKLDSVIDATSVAFGNQQASLRLFKERLKKATEGVKELQSLEDERNDLLLGVKALEAVSSAWSRYGIPLELVKGSVEKIQFWATSVYQGFDSGVILIEDVEDRGRPGLEFFLSNRKGKRSWDLLSKGERVMYFLAVRTAISRLLSVEGSKVDFLVLDEAMANLSPRNRDSLLKVVLGKLANQLFVTSHVSIPSIAEKTYVFKDVGGVSKVEEE